MQLLQKLRDSSCLSQAERSLRRVEERARELSPLIEGFLSQVSGDLYTTYTGLGYLPASILYWYLHTVSSSSRCIIGEVEEITLHLLPYREVGSVIVFSTEEYSKLISALQAIRVLNYNYLAFAPTPLDNRLYTLLKHYSVNTYSADNPVEASLLLGLSVFHALARKYRSSLQSRGLRLAKHSEEGFAPILSSLVENYRGVLEEIADSKELVFISSSRLLESSVFTLIYSLRKSNLPAYYIPLELTETTKKTLLVLLSVEDRIRREYKSKAPSLTHELILNTDPLEAGLYVAMLSYYLLYPCKE
jgi:hypothetical protein